MRSKKEIKSKTGDKLPDINEHRNRLKGPNSRQNKNRNNKNRRSRHEEIDADNPFFVPLDENIFKVKEMERIAKKKQRELNFHKNIWEKGIKSNQKSKLKNDLKDLRNRIMVDEADEKREAGLIEAADNALKNRIVQREQMQKFIEKKREMFLMQMTIDQKKEQIKQLEEMIHTKKKGLEKAEKIIVRDLEKFNKHLIDNKRDSNNTTKLADKMATEKQTAMKQLKRRKDQKANEISNNTKRLETLEEFYKYKEFLDKLAENEFKTNKQSHGEGNQAKSGGKVKPKIDITAYNISLSRGLINLINDPDEEFEPYFNDPQQIMRIFQDLEEKNLYLIRISQELEQTNDEIRKKKTVMEKDYTKKIEDLNKKKKDLHDQIKEKERLIRDLKSVRANSIKEIDKVSSKLENEIKKTAKHLGTKKKPLQLLTELERTIEGQLTTIQNLDENVRAEAKSKMNEARNREKLVMLKKKEQKLTKLKKEKMLSKEVNKRRGRPIMARSHKKGNRKDNKKFDEKDKTEIERLRYFT